MAHSFLQQSEILKVRPCDNVNLGGDSSSSWRLISSDHDNLDTGISALFNCKIDTGSGRVIKRNKADQSQVVHREPSMNLRLSIFDILPGFPAFHVKLITWILSKDFRLKLVSSESKDSLTKSS